MARLPRLSLAGHVHHVIQRGHNGTAVFLDDADRQAFLDVLQTAATEQRVTIHAYALLDSDIHLLATPATPDSLSKVMQVVGRRHGAAFNRRHGRSGTLWEGRFRATVLEPEAYFLRALSLIESSPVRAGLVPRPENHRWSSAAHHLGGRRDPLVSDHPQYWRLGNTPFEREAAYRRLLEQGLSAAEESRLVQAVLKGWVLGEPAFLKRLAAETARPLAARPRGRPRKVEVSAIDPV